MIKTYNPKETKKWLEYSSLLVGVILIIWGVISHQTILLVLGFFFILVVSNKTEIIINNKGIVITTTTLFLMKRKNIPSGGKWEDIVGYSRAVRVGNMIFVAGTTAHSDVSIIGINDPYTQSMYILNKIESAIKDAGGQLKDVVSTRMFVTNISNWEEIGRAHGEFFKNIKPVATMVEVSSLIDPGLLVEIEAIAVVQ